MLLYFVIYAALLQFFIVKNYSLFGVNIFSLKIWSCKKSYILQVCGEGGGGGGGWGRAKKKLSAPLLTLAEKILVLLSALVKRDLVSHVCTIFF